MAESALSAIVKGAADFFGRAKETVTTVFESIQHETLRDGGLVSAQNNTSVISILRVDEEQVLFTADAGVPALEQALSVLEDEGFTPGDLDLVQVPHHGSRRNVGPTVLNRLLGPIGSSASGISFVSAPAKNPDAKHPAKKVTNAFLRRGYTVYATQGTNHRYSYNAPERPGWSSAITPVAFYSRVEDDG